MIHLMTYIMTNIMINVINDGMEKSALPQRPALLFYGHKSS